MSKPASTTRVVTVALTGLLALTIAGCSSSSTGGSGQANTSAAVTSSTPTPTVATTTAASSSAVTSPAVTSATATSAAPIATGAKAPAGNVSVRFGTSSLLALTNFTTEKNDTVKLTISLKPGTLADLAGFDLDAQTKKGTPFYVSYALTNLSSRAIDSSGFAGRLTASNAAGDEAATITLLGDFPKCEGDAPDKLAPGASGHGCEVYIVPKGQKVTKVAIPNGDNGNVTWS